MKKKTNRYSKAFTLVELLLVVAIISLLSSIVVASLKDAKIKSRDSRRAMDMRQIQTALEMYFDKNQDYPGGEEGSVEYTSLVTQGYIASIPLDPLGRFYQYQGLNTSTGGLCAVGGTCLYYHFGITFEGSPNSGPLKIDRDINPLPGDTVDGVSTTVGCAVDGVATPATDLCYDVTPY